MKKWSMIMSMVIALVILAVTSVTALAQNDEGVTDNSVLKIPDGLAIVAPLVTPVNNRISITVFKCSDQEPIQGAGVWLITKDKLEVLRQEMATVKADESLSADQDTYERLLGVHGTFLDRTDEHGKVWHSFENAGRYILVAVLRGYLPDHRTISVGMLPRALAIDAPRRAEVDEKVTITVFQRGTEEPVKDAGVWAFTRENAEFLKADMSGIRESGDSAAMDAAFEEACRIHGIFLGTTNGAGKVKHAFEEKGVYVLLARKAGFFPAWRPISIGTKPRALAIDAPRKASVGDNVTITILQRGTEVPVKGASVWAFTREGAQSLKADMAGIRESGEQDNIDVAIEEACNVYGIDLGPTNGAGEVTHEFENAGGYLLIAVKKDFFPGWRPIVIIDPTAEVQKRPEALKVDQSKHPSISKAAE